MLLIFSIGGMPIGVHPAVCSRAVAEFVGFGGIALRTLGLPIVRERRFDRFRPFCFRFRLGRWCHKGDL